MYILNIINQIKNTFLRIWGSKNWKRVIIYSIIFVCVFWYATRTLNSMIRRDRIELPIQIEEVISSMYASQNEAYAQRMAAYRERQAKEKALQQQPGYVAPPQQQVTNRGGRKTSYTPINALVIIIQLISMSAICCSIIFLVYKKFTKDSVPQLPVLYTKGKLNEE